MSEETKVVYEFDQDGFYKNNVILDESDKSPSGAWNIPARCTALEPPAEQDGYLRKWNGESWEKIENHVGEIYWLPSDSYDSSGHVMKQVGALPDGAMTEPPEQTEKEKADAAAQEEADSISVQLDTIERKAVRAMLNGSAVSSLSTEYQAALASVTDSAALKMQDYFPEWSGESVSYGAGDRVTYNGTLYKVLQAHTSQAAWTPDAAPSLFAKVLTSTTGEPLPWEQPGSTNPYMKGDRVTYNGKTYESLIDNNVWSPDAYPAGWKEVS